MGILGNNVNGATLTNVTVSGTGGDGASFTGTSTGINASNFSATGNGGSGLSIVGDGTYNFTGTTLLRAMLSTACRSLATAPTISRPSTR